MTSDLTHFSDSFPTKMSGFGFHEESCYSAHEEQSFHFEEEFHTSSNIVSSGATAGMMFFQPSKFQTMPGHEHEHDAAHRFDQGHGMKHQNGGWNDAHRFDQGHGKKHQNGCWNNNGHDAHRFDQTHGLKHQNGGWNDAQYRFDQGHGMKHQNGGWNNGHHLDNQLMNGKYGTATAAAAHTVIVLDDQEMSSFGRGRRFGGFNDGFGGGYGRHINGCSSNVEWMSKAI